MDPLEVVEQIIETEIFENLRASIVNREYSLFLFKTWGIRNSINVCFLDKFQHVFNFSQLKKKDRMAVVFDFMLISLNICIHLGIKTIWMKTSNKYLFENMTEIDRKPKDKKDAEKFAEVRFLLGQFEKVTFGYKNMEKSYKYSNHTLIAQPNPNLAANQAVQELEEPEEAKESEQRIVSGDRIEIEEHEESEEREESEDSQYCQSCGQVCQCQNDPDWSDTETMQEQTNLSRG